MSTQAASLNKDSTGKPTSALYGDVTDVPAGDEWFLPVALRAGASPDLTALAGAAGTAAATAVTNPASSATLAAALKGILTLLPVSTSSQGASAVGNGQTGANASVVGTLLSAASKRTWLTHVGVSGLGATRATTATRTIARHAGGPRSNADAVPTPAPLPGPARAGGTRIYDVAVPAGATTVITPISLDFAHPLPASADNTPITATLSAFGAGNTVARVNIYGFVR